MEVARTIRIAASADAVWNALTNAAELGRWFPMRAEVHAGEGGIVAMTWADESIAKSRIDVWEPRKHLRLTGIDGGWLGALVTDYKLEVDGESTELRVVTSGIDDAADGQDAIAEIIGGGWDFQLNSLRHYIEKHSGEDRIPMFFTVPYSGAREDTWQRICGLTGWLPRTIAVDNLTIATQLSNPPKHFVASIHELNDALLRIDVREFGAGGEVWCWMNTFGIVEGDVQQLQNRWSESLASVINA